MAAKAATGLLLGLLSSEEVAASLLGKAGFNEITNDADKEQVLAAYQEFLGILQNADYSTQGALDRALAEADHKLGGLTVTRTFFNPRDPAAHAGQEHGDEICRPALLRHVGAAALPGRDRLSSLCRNGDACQPEEKSPRLNLAKSSFRARGTAVIEEPSRVAQRRTTTEFQA